MWLKYWTGTHRERCSNSELRAVAVKMFQWLASFFFFLFFFLLVLICIFKPDTWAPHTPLQHTTFFGGSVGNRVWAWFLYCLLQQFDTSFLRKYISSHWQIPIISVTKTARQFPVLQVTLRTDHLKHFTVYTSCPLKTSLKSHYEQLSCMQNLIMTKGNVSHLKVRFTYFWLQIKWTAHWLVIHFKKVFVLLEGRKY